MPGPPTIAERRPDSSTSPNAGQGALAPAERTSEGHLRLLPGSDDPHERRRAPSELQVVLVTEGGLELPLVASPPQVARLLHSASETGHPDECDGRPVSSPNGGRLGARHRVRTDQILSRVRVVIRPGTSAEWDAS